jgi:hypothetical protein
MPGDNDQVVPRLFQQQNRRCLSRKSLRRCRRQAIQ